MFFPSFTACKISFASQPASHYTLIHVHESPRALQGYSTSDGSSCFNCYCLQNVWSELFTRPVMCPECMLYSLCRAKKLGRLQHCMRCLPSSKLALPRTSSMFRPECCCRMTILPSVCCRCLEQTLAELLHPDLASQCHSISAC